MRRSGLLSEARDQAPAAPEWNIRCVTLFDQFPSPLTGRGPPPGPGSPASLAPQPWRKPGVRRLRARVRQGLRLPFVTISLG